MSAPPVPVPTTKPDPLALGVEAAWRAMWAPGEPTSPAPTEQENPFLWALVRAVVATTHLSYDELRLQLVLLAKLAADTPQFYNPLHVFVAKELRDQILAEHGVRP